MTSWEALEEELDRWAKTDRCAAFWWRDDDAVAPGVALTRLLDLAADNDLPLALAVIPDPVQSALAEELNTRNQNIAVLQHGLAHENLAPPSAKKCELLGMPGQTDALATAREHLAELFGTACLPVLVPPWNRIAASLIAALPASGFTGLSTFTPRRSPEAAPGLRQVNCHVDLMRWRPERAFAGGDIVLGEICRQLEGRRVGTFDSREPCGLLTHHLVQDDTCWSFLADLLHFLKNREGASFRAAQEIFQESGAAVQVTTSEEDVPLRAGGVGT